MKKLFSLFMTIVLTVTVTVSVFSGAGAIEAEAAVYNLPYYYHQLSEKEQGWYKQIKSAALANKRSVKLSGKLDEETLTKLVNLIYYYDVQVFHLGTDISAEIHSSYATLGLSYTMTNESFKNATAKLEKEAEKVLSKFDEDTKTYTKIKTIHDYIINNCDYDKSAKYSDTPFGALCKGKAKCDGYSYAFAYLCSRAGIRTVNVIGQTDEGHMWNKVYYNKKWYNVDVTYDDPVGNTKKNLSYAYFMVDDAQFNRNHTPDKCAFKIPEATDSSKTYYSVNKLNATDYTSAKEVLTSAIAKAAKNKKTSVTIHFDSEAHLNSAVNKLEGNNGTELFNLLEAAQKKCKTKFVTTGCLSYSDPITCTYTIYIFYPKTKLSDYYNNPSEVDTSTKEMLNKLGVAA